MPLGMEERLGPGDFVLDGDRPSSPFPKKEAEPPSQFLAHVDCGQMAGWIKMALGTEVSLGPGYIVLDWDPTPLPKRGRSPPPQFLAHFYCGQTAGMLDASRCHSVWR